MKIDTKIMQHLREVERNSIVYDPDRKERAKEYSSELRTSLHKPWRGKVKRDKEVITDDKSIEDEFINWLDTNGFELPNDEVILNAYETLHPRILSWEGTDKHELFEMTLYAKLREGLLKTKGGSNGK